MAERTCVERTDANFATPFFGKVVAYNGTEVGLNDGAVECGNEEVEQQKERDYHTPDCIFVCLAHELRRGG